MRTKDVTLVYICIKCTYHKNSQKICSTVDIRLFHLSQIYFSQTSRLTAHLNLFPQYRTNFSLYLPIYIVTPACCIFKSLGSAWPLGPLVPSVRRARYTKTYSLYKKVALSKSFNSLSRLKKALECV